MRVVTFAFTSKEFFIAKWHYYIFGVTGHRDVFEDLFTGAPLADIKLIMVQG